MLASVVLAVPTGTTAAPSAALRALATGICATRSVRPHQVVQERGVYQNPYDLMTFYDNHDMPRLDADESGFIDAHNWLFTSRGTPVIYYGSESGFRAGKPEHGGNRDYFGLENLKRARSHPIREQLQHIARIRQRSVALQRGLQVNLRFAEDTAAFYRVFRHEGVSETALVLLNKAQRAVTFDISEWLGDIEWRDAGARGTRLETRTLEVSPHSVRVLLSPAVPTTPGLHARLARLHLRAQRGGR